MNARVAFGSLLIVIVLLLLGIAHLRSEPARPPSEVAPQIGSGAAMPKAVKPGRWRSHPELAHFTSEEARAYAVLGQLQDGSISAIPPVSDAVAAELEPMRSFLAEDRPFTGEGRIVVTPGGSFAVARDHTKNGSDSAGPSASAPVATARVPAKTEIVPITGDIRQTDEGQVISGKGVWAAISLDPSRQNRVRILDRGEGGYAICIRGEDFGTVRVNGGLAVPGRYYAIDGQIDITSQSAIGIEICPLIATLQFYAPPLPPPTING